MGGKFYAYFYFFDLVEGDILRILTSFFKGVINDNMGLMF